MVPVAVVAAGVNPMMVLTTTESRAAGPPPRVKLDPAGVNSVVVVAVLATDAVDPVAVHTPTEPRVDGEPPMSGSTAESLKGSMSTLG